MTVASKIATAILWMCHRCAVRGSAENRLSRRLLLVFDEKPDTYELHLVIVGEPHGERFGYPLSTRTSPFQARMPRRVSTYPFLQLVPDCMSREDGREFINHESSCLDCPDREWNQRAGHMREADRCGRRTRHGCGLSRSRRGAQSCSSWHPGLGPNARRPTCGDNLPVRWSKLTLAGARLERWPTNRLPFESQSQTRAQWVDTSAHRRRDGVFGLAKSRSAFPTISPHGSAVGRVALGL